jgi:hypothetical protein
MLIAYMICPVTLEPFLEPRVLLCGHTVDTSALKQMIKKECPLCKQPFESWRTLPINWILTNHMMISKSKHETNGETHKKLLQDNIPTLQNKIAEASKSGFSSCKIYDREIITVPNIEKGDVLFNLIRPYFQNIGFGVTTGCESREFFMCSFYKLFLVVKW